MSEPMVSHDCVAFYLLSEEVSKHVKVVQSGQGADEMLAGYDWYPPLADVPPRPAPSRPTRRRSSTARTTSSASWSPRSGMLDEDPSAATSSREHFGRPGATDRAGRRAAARHPSCWSTIRSSGSTT